MSQILSEYQMVVYDIKESEMRRQEVLEAAKKWWAYKQSDIFSTANTITTKGYKLLLSVQHHLQTTNLSKLKKDAFRIFSDNRNMKTFVINNTTGLKTRQGGSWYSQITDGKLILANFANIPTGNLVFNKCEYFVDYYELEIMA